LQQVPGDRRKKGDENWYDDINSVYPRKFNPAALALDQTDVFWSAVCDKVQWKFAKTNVQVQAFILLTVVCHYLLCGVDIVAITNQVFVLSNASKLNDYNYSNE
jgi:hypothetical protein